MSNHVEIGHNSAYATDDGQLPYYGLQHPAFSESLACQPTEILQSDQNFTYCYHEEIEPGLSHTHSQLLAAYTDQVQHDLLPSTYPTQFPPEYHTMPSALSLFPDYDSSLSYPPQDFSQDFLQPSAQAGGESQASRTTTMESKASSTCSVSEDASRSTSPCANELSSFGYRNERGSWNCAFPGCSSRTVFHRGCDLRKHYRRHNKSLFCRHAGCPKATEGGFSSKKDLARHEAKHNPRIMCEWQDCDRLFSRVDNMKDHMRRIHLRTKSR